MFIASAATAGFWILLNAAAAEPEGTVWTKYNNVTPTPTNTVSTDGRIPIGTSGKGDATYVAFPAVITDGATYKMWYGGHDGTSWRIYYATSPDGLTWTKYDNTIPNASDSVSTNGRIPLGTSGKGDSTQTTAPAVIKDGATYKMWYGGLDGTNWRIYYATSSNGLTWNKYDNTIPSASDSVSTNGRIPLGTAGKGDSAQTRDPAVIKDGSTYKMWYGGHDGTNWRSYYATSPDGLTWTKYNNVVPTNSDTTSTDGRIPLGTAGKGDDYYIYGCAVIKDGNTYKGWYTGVDGAIYRIYYATSPDGLTWTKYTNDIPANSNTNSTGGRVPLGTAGKGDETHVLTQGVIKVGYTYYMWYGGASGNYRIYHARIWPPVGTIMTFH
ncbi:MAG: hypothetical protein HYV35_10380 [Lentisphaerae bacterium]|nr:hypothetical protein [Lentisphaerota bacterium]